MSWNPYDNMPETASFNVVSNDVRDGEKMPLPQASGIFGAGGADVSPHLSWSGFPAGTQSFAVTVLDPDVPTPTGFWHWAVADIPGDVTELATGVGDEDGAGLPSGAFQLPNDARMARFIGAAPPPEHGPHRFITVVHALDTAVIGVPPEATPAFLGFQMLAHTLGRAVITPWYEA